MKTFFVILLTLVIATDAIAETRMRYRSHRRIVKTTRKDSYWGIEAAILARSANTDTTIPGATLFFGARFPIGFEISKRFLLEPAVTFAFRSSGTPEAGAAEQQFIGGLGAFFSPYNGKTDWWIGVRQAAILYRTAIYVQGTSTAGATFYYALGPALMVRTALNRSSGFSVSVDALISPSQEFTPHLGTSIGFHFSF